MSDYGAIIGGTIGAVVGGFATGGTGAQWGWMIGSSIGGAWSASQQVIPGPKIGEVSQQTAQEGGPRPIVFGRSHPIAGNIIADGGPRIVVTPERQGKGGPKVESESAFRTYAVAFSEGEADLLQVWRNNTLVYDAEDPSMSAENAEFLTYARWFRGDYQQMPSPDLEAVLGVGNVHGHRGTAYLVLADEDVTDQRGSWSQWKVRVFRGGARITTSRPYPVEVDDQVGILGARVGSAGIRSIVKHGGAFSAAGLGARIGMAELRESRSDAYADSAAGLGARIGTAEIRSALKDADAGESEVGLGARIGSVHKARVRFDATAPVSPVRLGARIGTGELT